MIAVLTTEKPLKIFSKEIKFINVYGTFFPIYKNNDFFASEKLGNKILNFKPEYICIGYDVDDNGEFMAYSLRNRLIEQGFSKNKIFRTPLTEKGYIMFNDFPDIEDFLKIKKQEINFFNLQIKNKIKPLGIRKTISLYELQHYKDNFFIPNNNGTSTFTYLYKSLKKENENVDL